MDNFPVNDIVEQAVTNQVNSFIGNRDTNLNTIVKMVQLNEVKGLDPDKMKHVVNTMYKNNQLETYFINTEYQMTMDSSGNIVYIDEEQNKTDTRSVVPESCGSETDTTEDGVSV